MKLVRKMFVYSRIQFAVGLLMIAALTRSHNYMLGYTVCYLLYGWLNLDLAARLQRYSGNRRDHAEICAHYNKRINTAVCVALAFTLWVWVMLDPLSAGIVLDLSYTVIIQFVPAPNSS